jgi:branched-subunit amino acid aminotransferase/4-amino-4-deoxychorismate lyase
MEQRERYMIWQGEVVKEHPAEGLYLSQEMLSLGHVLYNAERHIALLNRSAEALYGKRLPLSADQLRKQTATLLQRNNPSRRGSVRITLTLNASGEYGIRNDEASIYDGFVMRSLSPKATYIEIAAPMPQHPTSAMAHTRELADALARCRGFEKGVIAKGENIVADIARPLVALGGRTLLTHPSTCESVEGSRIVAAAEALGYTIRKREVTRADLAKAEEVMILDWQGALPLARLEQRVYTHISIERIMIEVEKRLKP